MRMILELPDGVAEALETQRDIEGVEQMLHELYRYHDRVQSVSFETD